MTNLLFILLGFAALFISGKYLVVGGVQIARFFKIPTLIIGLTIVALGTSAPELLVSLKAVLKGHPDIAIGNIIGSNISNIALVLGMAVVIYPISVSKHMMYIDWVIMFLISILFMVFGYFGVITRIEGIIFLLIIIIYNYFSIKQGRKNKDKQEFLPPDMKWYYALLLIVASSIGLMFGAEWLIKGASNFARTLGVSERIISVSMIAIGTSVPEMTTSIIAAVKKESDISIGNIVGSNIFNIAAILGITATVHPIDVNKNFIYVDSLWMIGVSLLLFLFFVILGKREIKRVEGAFLLIAYCMYIYFLLN